MPQTGSEKRAHLQVVRGSVWFIVSLGLLALGGFLYWSVAAKVTTAELGSDLGRELVSQAGFLFSAVIFVNYLTNMGLPVAVARFAPANTRDVNSLFGWALLYTVASSLVGSAVFFAAAAFIFPDQNTAPLFEWGKFAGFGLFFLLVAGQSLAVLIEVRLVTLRRWGWVVARVVIVVLTRFPLFLIPALRTSPVGLLIIMVGPAAVSGFVGAAVLRRRGSEHADAPLRPVPDLWRPAMRFATVNYIAILAAQAPQFVLPLIVSKYEPYDYGAFYLAWTITTVVFLVPHATSQTVLAEASRDKSRADHQTKLGLMVAGSITLCLAVGAYLLAGPATTAFFGADYALTAEVLPRMVAAGVPFAVTAMLLARVRVLLLSTATVVITAAFALFTLVPATIMVARSGVTGAANAWLIGNIAAAFVALVATYASRNAGAVAARDPNAYESIVADSIYGEAEPVET